MPAGSPRVSLNPRLLSVSFFQFKDTGGEPNSRWRPACEYSFGKDLAMKKGFLVAAIVVVGVCGLLASFLIMPSGSPAVSIVPVAAAQATTALPPPPPARTTAKSTLGASCGRTRMNNTDASITLRVGKHGFIRLLLRPEWSPGGAEYARLVAAAAQPTSQVYRLEPGFLIQGRLAAPGVPAPRDNTRAPKLMERGEVGWAGGSAGPDYFIYLGLGPATWLGNPHEGTIFAEVADEESMQVASNVSLLPVPPTAPGQMHLLKVPVPVTASLGHVTHDEHEIEEPGRAATSWSAAADMDVTARLTKAELEARRVVQTSQFEAEPLSSLTSVADGVPTLGVLKVVGAVIDVSAAACAPSCHALPHTELHGDVVKWGESHVLTSAAACCAACEEHAAAHGGANATGTSGNTDKKPCNVWVWCSNVERCGKRHGQCWLKHAKQLWADQALTIGTSEAWTAGTVQAAPAEHPSGAGRFTPSAADADLALDLALAFSEPSEPSVVMSAANGVVAGDAATATTSKRAGSGAGWPPVRTVRLKIRDAAPRSAARLRALAHAAAAPEAAREWAVVLTDAATGVAAAVACAADGQSPSDLQPNHSDPPTLDVSSSMFRPDHSDPSTASPFGVLTGGLPVPKHWGQATLLDGFGVHARWPRGAAILHGSLGAGWAGTGIRNGSFRMRVPVEAHPVPVLRGSVCWSTLGADGPDFFIALADHPQLGVAHTVVGEVVREDFMLLDRLADDVARGRLRLPARLRVRSLDVEHAR